ncbi:uncharacterized protein LOC130441357 isoform X1 [Diorhabda sublineata]|uniref:uncharacterized protein LOC130441357 isoform X1 n=1 Tax=Diorhabda sublineata TaxID=1163346 RepID=UPI0024E109D4|nr:uncharacterized protein LOC130441357 isoform X1 [Diorhabda sublineata]
MSKLLWCFVVLACLCTLLELAESKSVVERQVYEDLTQGKNVRNKRAVDVVTGVKNAVLGFVFNPSTASKGFSWEVYKPKPTRRPISTTTVDAVSFNPGEPVSLEVPDTLFGSSFTLITNLSTSVGDYFMNSAIRLQRLLESMRPFLRAVVGSKNFVIEGPTDKPIFSDSNSS